MLVYTAYPSVRSYDSPAFNSRRDTIRIKVFFKVFFLRLLVVCNRNSTNAVHTNSALQDFEEVAQNLCESLQTQRSR